MKIDWWTLGLQTINVLVLLWVLQRFLLKPVQAMIVQRQKMTQQLIDDASLAKQQAEDEKSALQAQHGLLAAERERVLGQAHTEATAASAQLLAQARQDAAQLLAAAQETLQHERTQVQGMLQNQAGELAVDITRRLLTGLPATSLNRHFIDLACNDITALADSDKKALCASLGSQAVQIVAAGEVDPLLREELKDRLSKLLGQELTLAFVVDPALLAGVELHFQYVHINSNLHAYLQRITQQLAQPSHDHVAA